MPVPTARPKAPEQHSTNVWIPITVVHSELSEATVSIRTVLRSGKKLAGVLGDPSVQPHFNGAAYAQVESPFGSSAPVQAEVQVVDKNTDATCDAYCLNDDLSYRRCKARVVLSKNPEDSDKLRYATDLPAARKLSWNGAKRIPDPFMFLCKSLNFDGRV